MLDLKTILDELTQSSDSILATSVLSRDGVTLSGDAADTGGALDGSGYAFPLVAATASYGHRLYADLLDGELDWLLLTNDKSQLLIGQSGPNRFLCCLLALDAEVENIIHPFNNAAVKIQSLLD